MTPQELLSRRRALGLSQSQLAKRLAVRPNSLARWERGVKPIGNPVMLDLALRALADEIARAAQSEDK